MSKDKDGDWRRYRIRQDQAYYGNKYTISGRPKKELRPQPSLPTFKCLEDIDGEKST